MKYQDFIDEEFDFKTFNEQPITAWRKEITRVLDAYIRECEMYRVECQILQEQVTNLTEAVLILKERLDEL